MKIKTACLILLFFSCKGPSSTTNHIPAKDKFYIFLMAGQSNMAGRGIVEPQDTVVSQQVMVLDKNNEWVYAKEPLHYYEPTRIGLDCGLSFGKTLSGLLGKDIKIGLVPCAVGGSSIEQWLGDSTYRNVTLYSNFLSKLNVAAKDGTIKGMIWHQGESNAGARGYKNYRNNLVLFFDKVRKDVGDANMPVYAGEIGSFLNRSVNPNTDSVNKDLHILAQSFKNFYVINTADLTHKPDTIHFDSRSQREMGIRFAKAVYQHEKNSSK